MFRQLSPPQYHPLSRKGEQAEAVFREKRRRGNYWRSLWLSERPFQLDAWLCARTHATTLLTALSPTSPVIAQLNPPPVPPLQLKSNMRAQVGGHPELLPLSQLLRGASPTSTWSGQLLASSPTRCRAPTHQQAYLLVTLIPSIRSASKFLRSLPRFLHHSRHRTPTSPILRVPPPRLPRVRLPLFIRARGYQPRVQDNTNMVVTVYHDSCR